MESQPKKLRYKTTENKTRPKALISAMSGQTTKETSVQIFFWHTKFLHVCMSVRFTKACLECDIFGENTIHPAGIQKYRYSAKFGLFFLFPDHIFLPVFICCRMEML